MSVDDFIPNPGDPKAVSKGCICPAEANHHGAGKHPGGVFEVHKQCPLHGFLVELAIESAAAEMMADIESELGIGVTNCEECPHYLTPWKCNGGTEEAPCPNER